ncbi:MAG: biotin/lipoyl-containing protein, partial [Dokdonella sp.]
MSLEIKVPVLPESVSDATIATWHKKPGDAVKRDENLVDLETDKVVLEVPAPADGILKSISAETGATVTSGELLGIIEEGAAAAVPAAAEKKAEAPKTEAKVPKPEAKTPAKGVEELSPAGRRVAIEEKIDPSKVEGTGRDGRVTKEDLITHANSPAPTRSAAPTPGARPEERVPMTRMRAKIAERLMQS